MLNRRRIGTGLLGFGLVLGLLLGGTVPAVLAILPVANDDAAVLEEDGAPTPIDVLANDGGVPPVDNRVFSVTQPPHGTVAIAGDQRSVTYTPGADYAGPDAFTYTITDAGDPLGIVTSTADVVITVEPVNDPPTAVDDPGELCDNGTTGGAFPIIEDWDEPFLLAFECAPTGNDTDVDGDPLDWFIVDGASHGAAAHVDPTIASYQPAPDYSTLRGDLPGGTWTSDTFTYRADDGEAESNLATYSIWVAPINDPPTFTPGGDVTVDEDSGPYGATWATAVSAGPANEVDQTVTFELEPNIECSTAGGPLFDDLPAIDGDGGLTFSVSDDVSGFCDVTFQAVDDGGLEDYGVNGPFDPPDDTSDAVTFRIAVQPVNDDPTAVNDTLTVDEDGGPTAVAVLGNDLIAPDAGETLTITARTHGAKGSVTITGGGTGLTYDPAPNAFGADSFTYTISDGNGGTDTATVSVSITAANDAPTAANDGAVTPIPVAENAGPSPIAVLANDTWLPDAFETLTITGRTHGAKGVVAITGGGTGLTYDPDHGATGTDTFTYTISDGHGGSDTATVTVLISADISGPVVEAFRVVVVGEAAGSTARVRLGWRAIDSQSAVESYQLQMRTDAGSFITVALPSAGATAHELVLAGGHTYQFRVRARDGAEPDNIGGYATSRTIRL